MDRLIAVIPCRAGSRRLPDKNVGVTLGGKLLFEHTAQQALDSEVFDRVVVITNGAKVLKRAAEMPGVTVMYQPDNVAHHTATSESVLLHVLEEYPAEYVALLQITNPLRTPETIRGAWWGMLAADADTCITACRDHGFRWDESTGEPLDFDPLHRPDTKLRARMLREMGCVYITRSSMLRDTECRVNGKVYFHIMPRWASQGIDTAEDLETVRVLQRAFMERGVLACDS